MSPSIKDSRRHGMLNINPSLIDLFPRPPQSISPPSPPPSLAHSCSSTSDSVLHTPPFSDDDHHHVDNDIDDTRWFDSPDSDSEDTIAWYARELGQSVSLHTPLPPSFPSRPDSLFQTRKQRHSLNRRSSVALPSLAFPSTQLDPAYPSLRRSVIPSKPPPPPPPPPRLRIAPPLTLPITPSLSASTTNPRPLPRTPLPADVCPLADDDDDHDDHNTCEYDSEYDSCDPFRYYNYFDSSDSDSVYSQDLDATDFGRGLSFAAITTTTTITTAATAPTRDTYTHEPARKDTFVPSASQPTLRSRWSSSTLASTPAPTASPSSRLRAYLAAARKGANNRISTSATTTATTLSSSPQKQGQGRSRKSRGSVSGPSMANVVAWAPTLLGVRRSTSRASASSSSESGQSDDSALSTGSAGLRRKPIPVEMFLRAT